MSVLIQFYFMWYVRPEERQRAMNQLMSLTRKCSDDEVWNKHFKMILLVILETMRDEDVSDDIESINHSNSL